MEVFFSSQYFKEMDAFKYRNENSGLIFNPGFSAK